MGRGGVCSQLLDWRTHSLDHADGKLERGAWRQAEPRISKE